MEKKEFIKDKHYYLEGDRVVFTALFLIQHGECCANGCKNCPYTKPRKKGNTLLEEEKKI
jgi:2-iminoacetate synthase ThiH